MDDFMRISKNLDFGHFPLRNPGLEKKVGDFTFHHKIDHNSQILGVLDQKTTNGEGGNRKIRFFRKIGPP